MNNLSRVQKKKKPTKLSGFILFAKELQGKEVKGTEDIFVSKYEINKAGKLWERLSKSEQDVYKQRAKNLDLKVPGNTARFNSLGENLNEVEIKRQKLIESVQNRKKEIQSLIRDAADVGTLDTKRFIFVSTLNFYYDSQSIYPAEIGLAKFSLKEGIIDATSIRINPGRLPMGSRLAAELHAKKVHKFQLPDSETVEGESDYIEICIKIVEFLKSEKVIPIFFTEGSPDGNPREMLTIENTKKILQLIFNKAGEYEVSADLKVYSVDELFFYLVKELAEIKKLQDDDDGISDAFSSVQFAHDRFMRTDNHFEYIGHLACDYHAEVDASKHCCLSRVKRYGYVIAKWCSQGDKYEIVEGQHFPKKY